MGTKKIPQKNDLVLVVVNNITNHGIYCDLKEYDGITAYCHISEIAGTFIRNIRNFVKVGQNTVAKVLRVSPENNQVDISLKRVNDSHKRDKIQEYKRQNAAIAICNLIAEKLKIKVDQVRNEIETPLIKIYGNMYAGFEEIAVSEGEVLNDYNFSTEMKKAILDVVAISIQISTVNISADLGVRSFAPDGVEHVKSLLKSAEDTANRFTEVNSKITTLGSPQYRINLEGRSYDEVLEVLDSIENELNTISKSLNVEYVIERKKN
tara:strand:+ start:226 stop:1020 length:795 start_codon:yes stop_codon:yes gene_type:complete